MPTKLQLDREFVRSVGIQSEPDNCDMCELYAIERGRRLEDLISSASCIAQQRVDLAEHRETIRMWQLATFAAVFMMLLFAFSSIHRGVQ